MLFVPEVETFIKYLENRSAFRKSEKDRLRQNIFESLNNKIVYNIDFINLIEEIIDEDHPLKDDSNILIKKMIDNDDEMSINIGLNFNSNNSDIIFEELCKYSNNEDILIGISESKEIINHSKNIINLNNVKADNKNHIFSKLLTNEVCQIRHTDLATNSDITLLLNYVYDLYNNYEFVIIIDRLANLNHNIYDHLINKSPIFKYYKLNFNSADAAVIKRKLKKYEIYNTTNPDLIHERTLIIKNLIITMDEDPYNIIHRNTWNITIEYSRDSTNKINNEKCAKFNKTLFCSIN